MALTITFGGGAGDRNGVVYAYDYGVRSNGSTPSAGFLQDACDAAGAGAGTVLVPSILGGGSIMMEAPVYVPYGVQIVGTGRRGTVFEAIPGTFPTSTPMFYLGSNIFLDPCFESRLVNCSLKLMDIAGSTGVYSRNIQEGAGLQGVGIYGWRQYGVWFETGGCQNFRCRDLEVYASSTYGGVAAVFFDSIGSTSTLEWATLNPFSTIETGTTGYGVWVKDSYGINLNQIHPEMATEGIRIDNAMASIIGCWGHIGVPTLIRFANNARWGTVISSNSGDSPVHIQDDNRNVTITSGQIGFYGQPYAYEHAGAPVLAYSASMTPNAGDRWEPIQISNGTAMTINSPSDAKVAGSQLTFDILNSSGGAHGAINVNAIYKLVGGGTVLWAGGTIANGKRRTASFYYDGTSYIETARSTGDIG